MHPSIEKQHKLDQTTQHTHPQFSGSQKSVHRPNRPLVPLVSRLAAPRCAALRCAARRCCPGKLNHLNHLAGGRNTAGYHLTNEPALSKTPACNVSMNRITRVSLQRGRRDRFIMHCLPSNVGLGQKIGTACL